MPYLRLYTFIQNMYTKNLLKTSYKQVAGPKKARYITNYNIFFYSFTAPKVMELTIYFAQKIYIIIGIRDTANATA